MQRRVGYKRQYSPSRAIGQTPLRPATLVAAALLAAVLLMPGCADPREQFGGVITRLSSMGLLTASDTYIALTPKGRLVGDAVMTEFALACGGVDVSLRVVAE